MNFEEKIKELKLELPEARDPVGSYVASKQIGKMLFIFKKHPKHKLKKRAKTFYSVFV